MFSQIGTNLSEINTLKCKINRLNMIVFNFCMQQQIFMKPMHEYIRLTHQTTFLMSNIPSSVLSLLNLSLANGFVKKFVNWFSVLTNLISQSPFCTWSRMKWCLISICLVLECCIGFLVKLIALALSQYKGTLLTLTP